jgi:hypothetical protein
MTKLMKLQQKIFKHEQRNQIIDALIRDFEYVVNGYEETGLRIMLNDESMFSAKRLKQFRKTVQQLFHFMEI